MFSHAILGPLRKSLFILGDVGETRFSWYSAYQMIGNDKDNKTTIT